MRRRRDRGGMRALRAFAYNIFFYLTISLWMLAASPLLLAPARWLWQVFYAWARFNVAALHLIAGTRLDVRGLENLPAGAALIVAKHQSAFETVSLFNYFNRPTYILKRELMRLPLIGWFITKMGMVPVDRGGGQKALRDMVESARKVLGDGRHIIIFPEGTRRMPGARPAYKHGVVHLYRELGVPVIPVALNSGLFWPRKGSGPYPGTIVVEFLPAILPGLAGEQFFASLVEAIETRSDALLLEGVGAVPRPPLSSETSARLAELTQT